MQKTLYTLVIFTLFASCVFEKNTRVHGVTNLIERQKKILVNKSNKNDVIFFLGKTILEDNLNEEQWLYIETHKIKNFLGKDKVFKNNALFLTFDNKGILKKKKILTIEDMKDLKIDTTETISRGFNSSASARIFSSVRKRIDTRKKELSSD